MHFHYWRKPTPWCRRVPHYPCPPSPTHRFHVFGEGLRSAELHEQTGPTDAVHVNAAFMATLRAAACKQPQPPLTTCVAMAEEGECNDSSSAGATAALGDADCGEVGLLGDLDLWAPYGWISGASEVPPAICNSRVLYPVAVEEDQAISYAAV